MASSSTNEGVGGSESSLAGYRAGGGEAFDVSNEAKVAELRHSIAKAFNAGNPDLPSNQAALLQLVHRHSNEHGGHNATHPVNTFASRDILILEPAPSQQLKQPPTNAKKNGKLPRSSKSKSPQRGLARK